MEYYARVRKIKEEHFVSFPDLPNVNTYGFTHEHALEMASEALNGVLESEFERGFDRIPARNYAGKRNHYPIIVLPHIALAYELKELRKNQTQSEIAKKLGISYQAYQKLENPRKCNPTVKTLEKLGKVLGKRLVVGFR
jgi:antitoxin HicB